MSQERIIARGVDVAGERPQGAASRIRRRIAVLPLALMLACTVALFGGAQPAYANPLDDIANFFTSIFAGDGEPYAAGDVRTPVVDDSTLNNWRDAGEGALDNSTQNVGRIWTDKTVSDKIVQLQDENGEDTISVDKAENSNFLVGLSAMSSTSNLTTTTTISKPLDIVLVLDNSETMEGDDLVNLKTAANGFVDMLAEQSTDDIVHNIAAVTFAGGPKVEFNLMGCTAESAESVKEEINKISIKGKSSEYESGLAKAKELLDESNRKDTAVQVVIVIGDGDRGGGGNYFKPSIAGKDYGESLTAAKQLKDAGVSVYSVCIGSYADATDTPPTPKSETQWHNVFMHQISSNYPDATDSNASGERAPGSNYMFAGKDYGQLGSIFDDIFEQVTQEAGSGSPTEVQEGDGYDPGKGGYITFTDTLGAYMEVTPESKMTVVYGDNKYTNESTNAEDGTTTYVFKSQQVGGNGVYEQGNLSNIIVQVKHSENAATGDTVTVRVPASLIPCRRYEVNTGDEGDSMSISPAYPIRIFYNVSIKDAALAGLAASDESMDSYLAPNTNADGTARFYSNFYDKDKGEVGGTTIGDTTATFQPSKSNSFYYFTQDTLVFKDEACEQPVKKGEAIDPDTTYYYEQTYYESVDDKPQEKTVAVEFPGSSHALLQDKFDYDEQGNLYIKAGTARLTRIHDFNNQKGDGNKTATAAAVVSPEWASYDGTAGSNYISAYLGNNGYVDVELPGELSVTKHVEKSDANLAPKPDQEFSFTLALTGAPSSADKFTGKVMKNGAQQGQDIEFSKTGGSFTLKDGETLHVYGLSADMGYTVTETSAESSGYITSSTGEQGTIKAGETAEAVFTNTYSVQPATLDGTTNLKVEKELSGREWREGDSFTFEIKPNQSSGNAPLPTSSTLSIGASDKDASYTKAFGDIEFSAPGEYVYIITEQESSVPGVGTDGTRYRVVVQVSDDGLGKLSVESVKMERQKGVATDEWGQVEDNTASFTNTYNAKAASINLTATKKYTDTSGKNPMAPNKFKFKLEALGGYKTDEGAPENYDNLPIAADKVPLPKEGTEGTSATTSNAGESVSFEDIEFGADCVGNTYVYRMSEVAGSEAHMNYDSKKSYIVTVAVTEEPDADGSGVVVKATAAYPEGGCVFNNTYDPEDAVLAGGAAICGEKQMTGRNLKKGESYEFSLTPSADTEKAIEADIITGIDKEGLKATATGDGASTKASFTFGGDAGITFTRAGVYTFTMKETTESNGAVTCDDHDCTVNVTVSLDKERGKLVPAVAYGTYGPEGQTREGNVFVNSYKATGTFGGLDIKKILSGRDMKAGEFTFTIEGVDEAAAGKLKSSSVATSVQNASSASDGIAGITVNAFSGISFDQNDVGKPFEFLIKEQTGQEKRMHYSNLTWKLTLKPLDNGDGTLGIRESVELVSDEEQPNPLGVTYFVTFVNTYTPVPAKLSSESALKVTKQVTGAPYEGDFTFKLTKDTVSEGASWDDVTGIGEEGLTAETSKGSFKAGGTATATFAELSFAKQGTYTFKVNEDAPTDKAGWHWDTDNPRTITVTVTDKDGDGALEANVTGNNPTFTNAYTPDPVTPGGEESDAAPIKVQKTVTGYGTDADFTFTLMKGTEADGVDWSNVEGIGDDGVEVTMSESFAAGEKKTASFSGITFKATGEYPFTLVENEGVEEKADPAGWTYDDHTATVTVRVTDDGFDGQLDAAIVYDNKAAKTEADKQVNNAAAFTNSYEAGEAKVDGASQLKGSKTLTGRNGLEGEAFEFTLSAGDDATEKALDEGGITLDKGADQASVTGLENGEPQNFHFGDMTIKAAGDYLFNVSEEIPGDAINAQVEDGFVTFDKSSSEQKAVSGWTKNGVTYDSHIGTYTVKATDDGSGVLACTVTPGTDAQAPDFTNSYAPTPFVYGEEGGLLAGTKTVKVESGEYSIKDKDFGFYMRPLNARSEDYPLPEETDSVKHVTVDDEGVKYRAALVDCTKANAENNTATYDFGSITFRAPGMYSYNIFENSGKALPGISYDQTRYTVTFDVKEDRQTGKLSVTASAGHLVGEKLTDTPMGSLDFTNVYNAERIEGHQDIKKRIDGRTFTDDDEFVFEVDVSGKEAGEVGAVIPFDELPKPADSKLVEISEPVEKADGSGYTYTATMKGAGATGITTKTGDTGTFTYTQPGVYTFVVTEEHGGETIGSMAYSDAKYTVVVTITQEFVDGKPVLKRSVTMNGESLTGDAQLGTMNFTNKYTPKPASIGGEGKQGITVQKTLTGRDWSEGDSFTFELSAVDGAPMPEGEGNKVTIAADKGGAEDGTALTSAFGAITYTKDDLGETADGRPVMEKEFTYTVKETSQSADGVTVDGHVAKVKVTVTDDGKGELSAKVEYDNTSAETDADKAVDNAAAFTNAYEPSGEVTVDSETTDGFDITKTLTGKAWNGDVFGFTISGESENAKAHLPEDTTVTVSKLDDEGGDIAEVKFGTMTFDAPGTYVYKVKENVPQKDDESFNPGMTYDDHEATVTVTVSDNLMGGYKAEVEVDEGTFTNKYDKTGSVEVDAAGGFAIVKHLEGRDIAKDQFEFTLSAAEDDAAAQEKLPKAVTVATAGAEMDKSGVATEKVSVPTGLKFTQADAGKSFKFTVSETEGGDTEHGYQNDGRVYAVEMKVSDDGEGTLTVAVYVDGSERPVATWTGAPKEQAAKDAEPVTFEFNNSYDAVNPGELGGKAEVAIKATKTLTGRDMLADEFSFVVKDAKGTQVTSGENAAAKDGEPAAVTFGEVEYKTDDLNKAVADGIATVERKDGKLVYRFAYAVSEETKGLETAGVTPEGKTSFDVTVTVTDDGAGNLTTAVSYPKGFESGLAFKNAYKEHAAEGNTISLAGTKVLESDTAGAAAPELAGGEFTFTLTGKAADGTPAPMPAADGDAGVTASEDGSVTVANKADGSVCFGYITYSVENVWGKAAALAVGGEVREKTFTYEVTEEGSLPGVHNDADATKTITVTVKDDGKGKLTVEKKADDGAAKDADFTFTNTYTATAAVGVPVNFEFIKTFEGHEWTGDYAFQFTMTGVGGAPMPETDEDAGVTASDDGSVTKTVSGPTEDDGKTAAFDFGSITYTEAGTYTYTVSEVKGDNPAIAYDTDRVEVTVNVTDKDSEGKPTGKLVATATMTGDPSFTNAYEAGTVDFDNEVGLAIRKTLTGRAMDAGDFTFVVTPTNEAGKELFGKDGITLTNDAAELGEGDTANVSTMTKALPVGRTFTKGDAGKSFEFTVSEQAGPADKGYTYDGHTYKVAIKVADDGAGKLTVETWVDGKKVNEVSDTHEAQLADAAAQVVLDFENTYEVKTPAVVGEGAAAKLAATKTLTGRDMMADEFTFEVRDAKENVVATGTNAAAADGVAGAVTFGDIKYESMAQLNEAVDKGIATRTTTEVGDVYEFPYDVVEVAPEAEGVTQQAFAFSVTVRVTDDGAGNLSAEVVLPEGGLAFTNAYGADAEATLPVVGKKRLVVESGDNAPTLEDIADRYTFTLTGGPAEDGTPAPMPEKVEATNDAAGNIDFGGIAYTMENVFGTSASGLDKDVELAGKLDVSSGESADAGGDAAGELATSQTRSKTFIYTVKESGEVAGIENDPQGAKTFTVTVTDNGDGTLTAVKGTADAADFEFTNTYSVDPTKPVSPTDPGAEGGVKLAKELTGRDMAEGEFSFELRDADGKVVSTGSNAADGPVSLSGISFDGPGTYLYTLSEAVPEGAVKGDDGAYTYEGVTYDPSSYVVTATVADEGDGTLSVAWSVRDADGSVLESVTFENAYEAAPTGITFNAAKVLTGRDLVDGEFSFELREGGGVVAAAENDAEGNVAFGRVEYTEPGEHDYEIAEVKGDDDAITYDGTVFTAHVSVRDDGEGHLVISDGDWSYGEAGAPVFRNTYTAPDTGDGSGVGDGSGNGDGTLVQTGDDTALMVGGALAAGVVLVGAGAVLARKKR